LGLFAHSTHVFIPDREHGKLVAGALLRTQHSAVMSTPYGKWLNVYLPLGLTYKDVPDLPTATFLEFNCYDSDGLDLRLYTSDRIAFIFESGLTDVGEEEDRLLEIASGIYEQSTSQPLEEPEAAPEAAGEDGKAGTTFWRLEEAQQNEWVERARQSSEFKSFVSQTVSEDNIPDLAPLAPYLPEGRSLDELKTLLAAVQARLLGPPSREEHRLVLEKWMEAAHSDRAEDYVEAIGKFFGFRGCLWSLETIQEKMGELIDRRIIPIDSLDFHPES
jgi:hypothetical protein